MDLHRAAGAHHLVVLDDGRASLLYNSGAYFNGRLFLKLLVMPSRPR